MHGGAYPNTPYVHTNHIKVCDMPFFIRSRVCIVCTRMIKDPTNWTSEFANYQLEIFEIEEETKKPTYQESAHIWCYKCLAMVCRSHVANAAFERMYYNVAGTHRFRCEFCLMNQEYLRLEVNICQVTGTKLPEILKFRYTYILYTYYKPILYVCNNKIIDILMVNNKKE